MFSCAKEPKPSLLLFSAFGNPRFHTLLLDKNPACLACGDAAQKIGKIQEIDYVQFCGGEAPDWERQGLVDGDSQLRITVRVRHRSIYRLPFMLRNLHVQEFKRVLDERKKINIIDVRSPVEFGICSLPRSYSKSPLSTKPLSTNDVTYNKTFP